MSDVVVAVEYESRRAAEDALAALEESTLRDAVIVSRGAGDRVELQQTHETSIGEGAISGGTAGLLAGLLFAVPVGGALLGVLAGGGFGARDTGIENDRLREIGRSVERGHAVLCVLVAEEAHDATLERLAPYRGVVLP